MKKAMMVIAGFFILNNEVVSVIVLTILAGMGIVALLNGIAKEKGHF